VGLFSKKKKNGNMSRREAALLDFEYDAEITFECPVRGTVTQTVKVKRFKLPELMSPTADVVNSTKDDPIAKLGSISVDLTDDEK
jgi:hypothetical protein